MRKILIIEIAKLKEAIGFSSAEPAQLRKINAVCNFYKKRLVDTAW